MNPNRRKYEVRCIFNICERYKIYYLIHSPSHNENNINFVNVIILTRVPQKYLIELLLFVLCNLKFRTYLPNWIMLLKIAVIYFSMKRTNILIKLNTTFNRPTYLYNLFSMSLNIRYEIQSTYSRLNEKYTISFLKWVNIV